MNITKQLEEVRNRIEEAAANHEKEIETLSGRIQEAELRGEKARGQAAEAYAAQDVKSYHAAQDAAREAKDAFGMYAAKLKEVRKAPQLSPGEYKELEAAVRCEAEEIRRGLAKKIEKHISAIAEIEQEHIQFVLFCNNLLHVLQHDIMKDDACVQSANGVRSHVPAKEKRLEHFNMLEYTTRRLGEVFNERGAA